LSKSTDPTAGNALAWAIVGVPNVGAAFRSDYLFATRGTGGFMLLPL